MERIGLVLGGGGAVGAAYHAGALAALEQDLGWDARTAHVIVGTSAGAIAGTLLRMHVPPSDLAAMTVGAPTRHTDATFVQRLVSRPSFPPFGMRNLLRFPRIPSPLAIAGVAALWWRRGPSSAASIATLLPDGSEVLLPHVAFLDEQLGARWPVATLLLCAVRRRDNRRTVFGPGGATATLAAAIAASCAVPGYFQSVEINGERYVDGGVISATNADVLRRHHDLDLAIIISPMTGKGGRPSLARAIRRFCRRALDHEVRTLRDAGIPTVVIEPGGPVLNHITSDFMSETASVDIVREAFLDTGIQIRESPALRSLRSGQAT
ncbi:MAG: patatin-like phospholipase family protein [Acidimicrobiia bacterium]